MRSGRFLRLRLEKLEAVLNVLSTTDKWALIENRARQLISDRTAISEPEDVFWIAMASAKCGHHS
jgi:hypothetical protein